VTLSLGCAYAYAWIRGVFSLTGLASFLSSFGALWLCVEIVDFFFEGTEWPAWIKAQWYWFLVVGIGLAAFLCFPRFSRSYRLHGRDVWISVMIADIFRVPGSLVVGSNATFDTTVSSQLISPTSIQGLFTRKFYDDEKSLNAEIAAALQSQKVSGVRLNGQRVGKSREYPIGTCVKVQPKNATAYFLAMSRINEHGVASSSFGDLQNALAALWTYTRTCGSKEPLVVPILGSGYSRLREPREKIIREIVLSFIAACSESVFTDKLTIVIHPTDVKKYGLVLDKIADFIRHQCEYTEFTNGASSPTGTAV